MLISNDDAQWSDIHMDDNVCHRQPNRDKSTIDPNYNILETPSYIGPEGKINLRLGKSLIITSLLVMPSWIIVSRKKKFV